MKKTGSRSLKGSRSVTGSLTGIKTGNRTLTGSLTGNRTGIKTGNRTLTGSLTGNRSRSLIGTKTKHFFLKLNPKKILAYCHSQKHEERYDLKIINTLQINEFDKIDTCDLYGEHDDDIKIDLSKRSLSETDRKQFSIYDIIYLVNCPSVVYIERDKYYNKILFNNLFTLLNDNGILIMRLSRDAIEGITKKVIEDISDIREALTDEQKKELLLNLQISIHKDIFTALNICEIRLQEFLRKEKIDLNILTKDNNIKYIKSGLNASGSLKFFIVIQKKVKKYL